ncbi:MAG TPA: GcrA family cell cycle regulator [Acidiphilium sp.]|uniref:GcrA family cell cycle regulator n=1 Tax=unclassified Acidiphilium TaxID=2617493 RepID=UPI000BDCE1F2|nr:MULTISPECIES: GcrA family cell cycle regulator [unclassified Acidiphilium]OYV57074.1 MAG: GcrA cell cycle regulator [Acidiphilium sp. 20-67-58]HQT60679.1 GcrA family cell cycle regulator [Acidiphilium sp.]HQU10886.1 GcrA family cell cycle regulator [Acidiphilium sp.]
MEWTDEIVSRLRQLWDEGLSTAEIGRRLNISKNSVVGKAHRLDLPARPSPIRRDPSGAASARPAPARVTGPTLPSLAVPAEPALPSLAVPAGPASSTAPAPASVSSPAAIAAMPAAETEIRTVAPSRPAAPARAVPARPTLVSSRPVQPQPRATARVPACCWPIGEPGTASFRFCGDPALANKPYCQPHAEIAYVRVRDRREDVA